MGWVPKTNFILRIYCTGADCCTIKKVNTLAKTHDMVWLLFYHFIQKWIIRTQATKCNNGFMNLIRLYTVLANDCVTWKNSNRQSKRCHLPELLQCIGTQQILNSCHIQTETSQTGKVCRASPSWTMSNITPTTFTNMLDYSKALQHLNNI